MSPTPSVTREVESILDKAVQASAAQHTVDVNAISKAEGLQHFWLRVESPHRIDVEAIPSISFG